MRYSHSQSRISKNKARPKMAVGRHLVNMLPEIEVVAFFKRITEIRESRAVTVSKAVLRREHLPQNKQ